MTIPVKDMEQGVLHSSVQTVPPGATTPTQTTQNQIPEARNLSWNDTFYDGQPGIVAVFDTHEQRLMHLVAAIFLLVGVVQLVLIFILNNDVGVDFVIQGAFFVIASGLYCIFSHLIVNHAAVTTEGVRVDDKVGCRNMLVSFQDVDSCERWGICCLAVVYVRIRNGGCRRWLKVNAIDKPQEFINLVMAMKSRSARSRSGATVAIVHGQV